MPNLSHRAQAATPRSQGNLSHSWAAQLPPLPPSPPPSTHAAALSPSSVKNRLELSPYVYVSVVCESAHAVSGRISC
jgi:hypothetical protein